MKVDTGAAITILSEEIKQKSFKKISIVETGQVAHIREISCEKKCSMELKRMFGCFCGWRLSDGDRNLID